MKLDFIENINAYNDNVVRLYDFDRLQAELFLNILVQTIMVDKKSLKLNTIDFIESRNCNLTLRISNEDLGISTANKKSFFCDLTSAGYKQMLVLLDPFTKKETKGFQYLYDVDSNTDFLFSPAGTW